MSAIPLPDVDTPPDDDLRRRAIPVDQPPAIPLGSTADLENRGLAARTQQARPIPISTPANTPSMTGSTEDLESRGLAAHENPRSAPIQTGVASLWTKAENIHNPILRVLGEIGAGGARALDIAGTAAGRVVPAIGAVESAIPGTTMNAELNQRRQAKQDAQQAGLAKDQAATEHEKAETGAVPARTGLETAQADEAEARAEGLKNPKPDRPEAVQQIYADAVQDAINRNVDPNTDPKVQQLAAAATAIQKQTAAKTPNDFEQYYSDWLKDNNFPDTSHNRLMARQAYARAGQTPQREPQQLGVIDGKIVALKPGMAVPEGTQSLAGDLKGSKPTADEQRRADLARNMSENLDQLEDIVKRRPELFGPVAGRITGAKEFIGTSDPDVAALKTIKEQTGMAMVGAHAMRNAQHVETAANSITNSEHNSADAVLHQITEARKSLKTFLSDEQRGKGASTQPAKTSEKKENDPLGIR